MNYAMLLARRRRSPRNPSLVIIQQPSNQVAVDGYAAFSTVAASSPATPLSYQWQMSKDGGSSWADVVGETSATIELYGRSALFDNGDYYRVIVGMAGSTSIATSEPAILSALSTGVVELSQTATSFGYSITQTTSLDGAFHARLYIQRLVSGSWLGWPFGTVGNFTPYGLLWAAASSVLRAPSGFQSRVYHKPFPEGAGPVPTESVAGYQRLAAGDTCRFSLVVDYGLPSQQAYYSDSFVNNQPA